MLIHAHQVLHFTAEFNEHILLYLLLKTRSQFAPRLLQDLMSIHPDTYSFSSAVRSKSYVFEVENYKDFLHYTREFLMSDYNGQTLF